MASHRRLSALHGRDGLPFGSAPTPRPLRTLPGKILIDFLPACSRHDARCSQSFNLHRSRIVFVPSIIAIIVAFIIIAIGLHPLQYITNELHIFLSIHIAFRQSIQDIFYKMFVFVWYPRFTKSQIHRTCTWKRLKRPPKLQSTAAS